MAEQTKTTEDQMQAILTQFKEMIDTAREEAAADVDAEIERRAQEKTDNEIAQLGLRIRQSDGAVVPFGEGESGAFDFHDDRSIGNLANLVLTEKWQPIVVKSRHGETLSASDVKEATSNFILGNPISSSAYMDNDDLIVQAMSASIQKSKLDPHARSLARTVENYTAGSGVEISSPIKRIQAELDIFWE